jgi:hypothetical protein
MKRRSNLQLQDREDNMRLLSLILLFVFASTVSYAQGIKIETGRIQAPRIEPPKIEPPPAEQRAL